MRPTGVIIFSGYNQRAVVAMCRTLSTCGIDFFIIACSMSDTILLTKYASNVAVVRRTQALEVDEICSCIESVRGETSRTFLIAPTSEAMNVFLLSNRRRLESSGGMLPLVSERLYRTVSNKASFSNECRKRNLAVPAELEVSESIILPVVAKPKQNMSPDGRTIYPKLIDTEKEWANHLCDPDRNLYFVQKYVHGTSYYLQFYFYSTGRVNRCSMRNLVQQPGGKSIVAAEPASIHNEPIGDSYADLFGAMNFTGLVMVEVIHADNQYFMIEANPRMWGPAQLMLDAGTNLYVSLINDYFGTDHSLEICGRRAHPLYFWWAGFWWPQLEGKPLKWHCAPSAFWSRYPDFFKQEVYCQEDTRGVFTQEAEELPIPRPLVEEPK